VRSIHVLRKHSGKYLALRAHHKPSGHPLCALIPGRRVASSKASGIRPTSGWQLLGRTTGRTDKRVGLSGIYIQARASMKICRWISLGIYYLKQTPLYSISLWSHILWKYLYHGQISLVVGIYYQKCQNIYGVSHSQVAVVSPTTLPSVLNPSPLSNNANPHIKSMPTTPRCLSNII
jgi:hypothetical protein